MAADDISASTWSENAANNTTAGATGWTAGSAPTSAYTVIRDKMAAIKRWWNRAGPTVTSGGSANAQTLTYGVAPNNYTQGDTYTFIAGFSNSGATTLNVNALGAKAVTKNGATPLAGGEILVGAVVTCMYDGTQFQLTDGVLSASPILTNHAVQIGAGTTTPTQLAAVAIGKFLASQGVGSDPAYASAVATVKQQNFINTGTYTPSTGMLYCLILALGAGAGGGGVNGTNQNGAGGGGAGQLAMVLATAAAIGASKAVTIGTAGTAGANTGGTGGNGGDTSVGTVAVGKGGSGGVGSAGGGQGAGGLGGTGGTSDIASTGAPGSGGLQVGASQAYGGDGGSSLFGGGGAARGTSSSGGSNAATGFGAGGGGASGNGNAALGGVGTAGVVYIIEFCSQ